MSALSYSKKTNIVKLILALSDFVFFTLSLVIAVKLIGLFGANIDEFIPESEMSARFLTHVMLAVLCVGWFWVRLRHYTYRKPFWFELKEIFRTLLIFAVCDLALVAFSKWQFSRYVWILTWTLALILVPLARAITKRLLNKLGMWQKHTIIIGSGKNACDAYAALQSEEVLGFAICGFFSSGKQCEKELLGKPVICDEKELWQQSDPETTQFIVALEFDEHALRDEWLKKLAKHHCRSVSVIPTLRGVPLYGTDMSFIFSHEVMILRVSNSLAKRTSRFLKRTFDIIGSVSIILLLSPILAILAYLVSKDGGKAIYGHERVGRDGNKFKCLKFRSMVMNSQEVLKQLLENDPEARAEWDKDFKLKNDPRITRVGKFIRKTSLDELPQLFNVLKGEMSLVGPRPVIEKELERYAGDVDYYLMAKPGMTGLWQVSGRNDVDYDTRVYFDAWYVKNWSLWNDIAILFKTINVVLKRDGAY
ncbi:undecaprenyl-phosphate galactose phosphotransferase WbaP [Serratia ficaria]|uniref:Putative colanic biosynthesis UDP-glucose lipid carrier transferase n=1 Tax=Serratia ficaria TaxID=61651 RepID=A0A240BRQ5_SERFI|nr:undecaprenyl-phosphate galactose phosphotransferase WbaP [Serratia ficaria]HBL6731999.1 undecaprenyl-phosphate galactose phosphotransferase WbaP [Serratia liquefaciens]MEE4483813.1 undecaprenyl-phosphate galactose phosphotransferase WbaP [Serratia ficaria]REF45579.1 undecaprenyl-phosphate galactose phosphotransferase [Serratia ficaria]CAI0871499.1 Putative colanic biosynthesis UDP-glucose lipid carrier transferase [Serratia ficaria]CAI0910517.1 Putative colanic biosynthesis UDP-glucose lipi